MHLTIEKLIYGGDGLARLPADETGRGKAVFVPFVLEGERIESVLTEQKPGFARARVEEILQPSLHRVAASCPYFQCCGGCQYQHASYEHQLEIKAAIFKENLRRIAKLELDREIAVHPSPPWNYRNRARLKVEFAPEFAVGYYRANSHALLPVKNCPISSPLINRAITALWEWRGSAECGLREVELFADAADAQLLVELYCSPGAELQGLADEVRGVLPGAVGVVVFRTSTVAQPGQNREPRKLAVSGADHLTYQVGDIAYRVSAGVFFQVNRHLSSELARLVASEGRGEIAMDLYAGVGLFSSILARSFAQVIAVEASQTAAGDLVQNSPQNVEVVRATAERYLQKMAGKLRLELIVVDPPRSGLGEGTARSLAKLSPARITYVSCDPATLARDLKILLSSGYCVEQAQLLDLFPQTYHMESLCHLVRS